MFPDYSAVCVCFSSQGGDWRNSSYSCCLLSLKWATGARWALFGSRYRHHGHLLVLLTQLTWWGSKGNNTEPSPPALVCSSQHRMPSLARSKYRWEQRLPQNRPRKLSNTQWSNFACCCAKAQAHQLVKLCLSFTHHIIYGFGFKDNIRAVLCARFSVSKKVLFTSALNRICMKWTVVFITIVNYKILVWVLMITLEQAQC